MKPSTIQIEKKRRPRSSAHVLRYDDGDTKKRLPNGLCAVVCTIRSWWHDGDKKRNIRNFVEEFLPIYNQCAGKYNEPPQSATDLEKVIGRLEANKQGMAYYEIRAYAEYIGIPPGILLLIAQMSSREFEVGSQEFKIYMVSQLLAMSRYFLIFSQKIQDSKNDDMITDRSREKQGMIGIQKDHFKFIVNTIIAESPRDISSAEPKKLTSLLRA